MSDRIEEQRYQQARQQLVLRNKEVQKRDLQKQRVSNDFATKLLILSKQQPIQPQAPAPQPKKPHVREQPLKKTDDGDKEKAENPKSSPRKSEGPAKKRPDSKSERKHAQNTDSFLNFAAHLGSQKAETTPNVAATPLPMLPPELIQELVDKVERSRTTFGSDMLTIDLKAQVLSGAHIQVSVFNGKVRLRFSNTDHETRLLLRNSESAIHRRLEEKNLSLSDFVVH